MTSEALMIAVTLLPSVRPSWRTASTVIEATRRTPPASSSTLAIASPVLMLVTRAGIWLRALSFMTGTLQGDRRYCAPTLTHPVSAASRDEPGRVAVARRNPLAAPQIPPVDHGSA